MELLIFIVSGILIGFTAGLFGVGGGIIAVPVLFFTLDGVGISQNNLAQQVIFTSLAIIMCTSTISTISHWQRGGTDIYYILRMSIGLSVGSILGSFTIVNISSQTIKIFLGIFFLVMAYVFAKKVNPAGLMAIMVKKIHLSLTGILIGWISVLFGIGGGVMNVAVFSGHGLDIKKSIGSSTACGLVISVTAILMSIAISSYQGEALLHYINLPSFISISLVAGLFSNLGAKVAHLMDADTIRIAFAVYLLILSAYYLIQNLIIPFFNL